MDQSVGTGNTSPVLSTVTVLIFLWALFAYFIRLYVKLRQSDGWKADVGAITAATVAALAQLVAVCHAVHRGYGMPWQVMSDTDRVAVEKSLYTAQIVYIVSVGAAKMSASFFIASVLARDKQSRTISRSLTWLCVSWAFASTSAIAMRGDDLYQPWTVYNGSKQLYLRWMAVEITGFALDIYAAVVIIYFLWNLQMKLKKKIAVSAYLNCRLLLAIPIAFRLYYLHTEVANSSTVPAETIRQVIIGSNIIFSALTCLRPFLKPFDVAAFGSHQLSRPGMFRYNSDADGTGHPMQYYELSAAQRTNRSATRKSMVIQSTKAMDEEDGDEIPLTDHAATSRLRPSDVTHMAEVRHSDGDSQSFGKNISKTQTWTVSHGICKILLA